MKKKYILPVLGIILAILTTITFILFNKSQDRVNLKITAANGDIAIKGIRIGETEYRLSDFVNKGSKEKVNKKLVIKENQKLVIEITKLHNIFLTFDEKGSKGIANIYYNNDITKVNPHNKGYNYYYHSAPFTKILKDELKSYDLLTWLFLIIGICILSFIYILILNYIVRSLMNIKNGSNPKIMNIISIFILYFIINYLSMLPVIEKLDKWYFIVIAIQLILVLFYLKKNLKIQNIFLFFSIILTVNMAILMPPFHVPDEYSHYIKAYSIFNSQDLIDTTTIKLYDSTRKIISKYNYDLFNKDCKLSIKEYFADFSTRTTGTKKFKQKFANTASINPFAYIPSAILIKVSILLNLPFIWSLILGRIINSLIFVLLGYISLKIIPYFKKILFLIMLFPITIQQIAAINQDSLTLSFIFIYIAIILNEIYGEHKRITKKTILLILLLSICVGMCKPAYFPLALLTILIPKDKFNSKKEKYLVRIFPFILCLGANATKYLSIGESINTKNAITISYGLKNPRFIINLILNTMYQTTAFDLLEGNLNVFEWLTISYDGILAFIIPYLYLMALCFNNDEPKKDKYTIKHRLFFFLIGLMIFGIIYASGIFSFGLTTIYDKEIRGLQARYFIPVTIMLYICLSNNFIKINIKNKNKNIIPILLVIITFMVTFYTIIKGSYI